MFVSKHGIALATFRLAIEKVDPDKAIRAAGEMELVSLRDSLELCRVLALSEDARFDQAGRRWLTLFAGKPGTTLADVHVATAAMGALAAQPDSEKPLEVLVGLIRAR
jgi:hypothetical protein